MRNKSLVTILLYILLVFVSGLSAEWTGTWSTSIYSDSQLDFNFANRSLRQVVRVSIPGNRVRLSFSNVYGDSSLEIQKVHLAKSTGGHTIDTGTDLSVTFSGSESVTIPAGGAVTSDAIDYDLPALTNMAISIFLGDAPTTVSGHVGSRTTSYAQSGDAVAASSFASPFSDTHWFFIDRIDVEREVEARAVVGYGDSITDGLGTTTDAQNRWTDNLATRLQDMAETSDVGVLNAGIGGTAVAGSGLNRLHPDVLNQTDVKYLIVLYGVNDILFSGRTSSQITSAYQSIITEAHNNGILVYGATIMPFGGYSRYTAATEAIRQEVNSWIRTTSMEAGGFDAVIDFDAALRNPNDHTKLQSAYSMDWLHPNATGYQAMGEAINLHLFTLDETPPAVPTGLAVTAQSYKHIDLDWNDNNEGDLSNYNVWRSTSSGGTFTKIATVTGSSYSDTGLLYSTLYYYAVSATDLNGNESVLSGELEALTSDLPDDSDPPTPNPSTWFTVPLAVGSTSITMAATEGVDLHGPVEYYFEETSGNPGGTDSGWQLENKYTNDGLTVSTEYTYRIRMRDDLGNIGTYSNSESATTFDKAGEYQETGGIVSMEAENGLVGSRWTVGNDSGASNGQYVEINPSYNYTGASSPECESPDCLVSFDFNISTSGNYLFWFRTLSDNANDDSLFWRIDNGSWHFENNRSGVGSWFSTGHGALSGGSHTLEVAYRENGTRLDKFVVQLDGLSEPIGEGPTESSRGQGSNDDPPAAPVNLSVSASSTQIDITWSAASGATSYNVKRSANIDGPYTVIAASIASNSFSDDTVVGGSTYYFVVSAENSYGESPDSDEVEAIAVDPVFLEALKVDFSLNSSPVQTDFEVYSAIHEQPASFTTQSFSAFGSNISVTPSWENGADATVMQMIDRDTGSFDDTEKALVQDWIGSDTSSTGDPLTLTLSGLPAGTYSWLSYHTDIGTGSNVGTFDVTVNDASGSTMTTDIQCTNSSVTSISDIAKFETMFVCDGVNDITFVFDNQPYSNRYNEAWFVMNGFELVLAIVPDPVKPVLLSPTDGQEYVSNLPTLQWEPPTDYTPSSYDVYFGTNPTVTSNPVYSVSTEKLTITSSLDFEETYYWTVVSYEGLTEYASEDEWSFTVREELLYPVLLLPVDNEIEVSLVPTLQWEAPVDILPDKYEVYLGTNPNVTYNPVYEVTTEQFTPAIPLENEMTYYWAVAAFEGSTSYLSKEEWSFVTVKPFKARDSVLGNMMLINDNAGWCWYQDDKIIYDPVGGNVLTSTTAESHGFGGVGGSRHRHTDVTTFNIATGKRTRVVARNSGGDDHNMGGLWVRPDGRYLHVYCDHYNDQVSYYRISTNPHDGSSWGDEQVYNWEQIPGPTRPEDERTSSYTNLYYVPSEGRLYNIIRVFSRTPCVSYSDDWGETWNFMGRLNDITGSANTYSNFYHKFRVHGDKIHFIGCEHHPRDYANSIYHGYIQNGITYDSFGKQIDVIDDMDAPEVVDFTTVWATGPVAAGQYHTAWTNEIEVNEDGYPVCLFQVRYGDEMYDNRAGAGDHRFFYGRFNGTGWVCTELGKLGGGMHPNEQDYTGMGCIHPNNANVVYVSLVADPRDDTPLEYREIFKGVTSDKGLTWDWNQITIGSSEDNTRPAIPQWDADNTAVFWSRGVYPGQEDYDYVLVGMVEELNQGLTKVTYIDADSTNTTEAGGSLFVPTGPSASNGTADSQWHEYIRYGNGGSCYTAGDGGTEDAPAIKTTISNLAEGTYDVFAYFWSGSEFNWGIRGGFSTSDMLCFSKQSSQYAEPSQFDGVVEVLDEQDAVIMYRVYIGRREVSGGSAIEVYFDNYDSSYSGGVPTRTTYDGVGVAEVVTIATCQNVIETGNRLEADLNSDCNIEITDFAILSSQWLSSSPIAISPNVSPDVIEDNMVDIADLAVLVSQWLECNDPENIDCTMKW